ncbi:MAG: 50S ribosomal protein L25/general stress protein Ctc [Bacteroidaceae bacterium]|nr:50S ribosomal protein L25/general stress protein Ctc [Bacteroidaceae bacterium]
MKEITLKAQSRTDLGKKASRDARRAGNVPAVVYGVEKEEKNGKEVPLAKSILVNQKELNKAVFTPNVYIVNLDVDGQVVKTIIQDIQMDFVKDIPVHVDFYQITEDKPIVMEIPVKLTGLAEGVKAGGKLSLNVRKLKVKGLYNQLPDVLTIDVTPLAIGKSLKVADLSFENVELVSPKEVVVCGVRMTRAARSAAAEQASEE